MTDNRIRTILLMLSRETVCPSQTLADAAGVSARTIKEDLRQLGQTLLRHGARIEAHMGRGYELKVVDRALFDPYFQQLTSEDSPQNAAVPTSRYERVTYIIKKLLSIDYYLQIENLASELLISRTTITRDMRDVRERLAEFGLTLTVRPNHGILLEGREADKRLCISEVFFHSDASYFAADNAMLRSDLNQKEVGEISALLQTAAERFSLSLSGYAFENMTVHLLIALRRWRFYNYVQIDSATQKRLEGSAEVQAATWLIHELENRYHLLLPYDEVLYFALHLQNKCVRESSQDVLSRQTGLTMRRIYQMLAERYGFSPAQTEQFDRYMRLHLPGMVQRLRSGIIARNPQKYDIFAQYPLAVHISMDICRLICEQYGVRMSADEFSYIVMYTNLLLLGRKKSHLNILLVCYHGRGEAAVLMNELSGAIESYFDSLTIRTYADVRSMDLRQYDLVLSTIPAQTHLDVPVVYLSAEPYYRKNLRRIIRSVQRRRIGLEEYLRPDRFLSGLPASDRAAILHQIAAQFPEKERVLAELNEAETFVSGELSGGIVLLHTRTTLPEKFIFYAGTKKPVIWKKQYAQHIFWVNTPQNDLIALETLYALLRERLNAADGSGLTRPDSFADYRAWMLGEAL